MADFLFVSQEMLDSWMMQGKIDFSGNVMTIRGDRRTYVLEPAVRFVKVVGEEADGPGLLGKVKTLEQVTAAGGEHYADSVLVEDTAYDVQNGFVARVSLPADTPPPPSAVAEGAAPAPAPASEAPAAEPAAAPEPSAGKGEVPEAVEPPVEKAATDPAPAPDAAATDPDAPPPDDDEDEAALLTRFLLDNLR